MRDFEPMAEDGPSPIERVLSGQRQPVDVGAIEKELRLLWRNVADALASESTPNRGQQSPTIARACMANLVIFAADDRLAERASQAIGQLSPHVPVRAIVVADEGESTATTDGKAHLLENGGRIQDSEGIRAWIQAHCQQPNRASPYVCSEQITISVPRMQVAEQHGLVFSLFVSDLPAILWWLGPLPETPDHHHLFETLVENCDLVVFSSLSFRRSLADLASMRRLGESLPKRVAFTDLSWIRIHVWRELLARLFDDPERLALLPYLDDIVLRYDVEGMAADGVLPMADDGSLPKRESGRMIDGQRSGTRSTQMGHPSPPCLLGAILLVAWLSERLGWAIHAPSDASVFQLSTQGVGTLDATNPMGRRINLELIPGVLPDPDPCGIIGIELNAHEEVRESEYRQGRFRIERLGGGRWVRSQARLYGQVSMERVAQFQSLRDGQLLAHAIGHLAPDPVFLRVLDRICDLVRDLDSGNS